MKQHKEDVLIHRNNLNFCSLFIVFIFLFAACNTSKKLSNKEWATELYNHIPTSPRYDTLDAEFLYEESIPAYRDFDVLVKHGGYVLNIPDVKNIYKRGYFILNYAYLKYISDKNNLIHYDYSSLINFDTLMFEKHVLSGGDNSMDVNLFCANRYKKYKLKIEVLFIGRVYQRVPLLMDCDEVKENISKDGLGYKMEYLPTYVITHIW